MTDTIFGVSTIDSSVTFNANDVPQVDENGFNRSEYEDAKERYALLVESRRNNALSDLQAEINQARENYEYTTRNARQYLWTLNDLKATEESLKAVEETKVGSLHDEFDALARHAKVEAVGIRNEDILIKTVPLDISSEGYGNYDGTYHLGQFEIVIPTTSQRAGNIELINRTNARENSEGNIYQHPHVASDGPCFGAIEEQLISLLAHGEYAAAFELILQYLQTYNPEDSYGDHIKYWID